MQVVELGNCCADCFDAIEGADSPPPPVIFHDVAQVVTANALTSIHTGEEQGFSWTPCAVCKSVKGGERWRAFGLAPEPKKPAQEEPHPRMADYDYYAGQCEKQNRFPLPFDEWLAAQR